VDDDSELLTTGQAAAALGCSRHPITDLCRSGRLPFRTIGTHRRIRRSDLTRLASGASTFATPSTREPILRERLRSLWLHRAVAGHLATEPDVVLSVARANLERAYRLHPRSRVWLDQWAALLHDPEATMERLTAIDEDAAELRQNSPFAGVLDEAERSSVLSAFGRWWRERDASGAPRPSAASRGAHHVGA
jgi:excisionase family DNA binding protein